MINKLLIANRGEIAVRIIKTCKKMGIQTVAVYSTAEEDAMHVQLADEAYCIGGPRVQESYVNAEKILEVARNASVDAIHPGYGFLSENAHFASQCIEAGIIFIGPSASHLQSMGNKIEARKMMKEAGLPVVPGCDEAIADVDKAVALAKEIGYPVMLKAAGGGGGIGMQLIQNEQELETAFVSTQKKAQMFFNNSEMYIEKLITNAHHIEIQLLGDKYGNIIHLFERDCSLQRRNQKVIEETLSPFISDETRTKMGKCAVAAASYIGYENAGTMEFLVDENQHFYFLEMNTRLQVEHPVTECITGLDLVEQQIYIAQGNGLSVKQTSILPNGHAIEARIYAEDPTTFYPSPGTITHVALPSNIRIDHYIQPNMKVTPFYDPMLAKVIAYAETREEAISHLHTALMQCDIQGIKTNIPLLLELLTDRDVVKGVYTTDFITKRGAARK
ncbi:acetyl-CoA carboxylase biotin carboxylase subunit [Priestia taiwanensis]|uniref:biotin carboxylase n=1 Tax=Priestia taiwanensis TaxID=1347902 RepID=A0A917ENV1_9BACI|nr:acetyl-CoA carboxylase biotin carboxylase subunit [Priestia taiwanensis]MBM7362311.1 acetyl-CoA carboxylase biotin carboxylase subunit [Priestia taiwanensis]GGE61148.1 acetyl-CoA carboxylase biotin carboxylase [Priestia taiwanensis]